MNEPEYFKSYKWVDGEQIWDGKYRKFETRQCVLIPIEIDRLEYLISYCLKNYYIKRANEVANGEFVPKWQVESQYKHNEAYNNGYAHGLEQGKDKCCEEVAAFKTESEAKILILEKELENRPALDNLSVTVNGERYKII
jgi:flagellar biosynthesis/type III secretory pathway protein FliH